MSGKGGETIDYLQEDCKLNCCEITLLARWVLRCKEPSQQSSVLPFMINTNLLSLTHYSPQNASLCWVLILLSEGWGERNKYPLWASCLFYRSWKHSSLHDLHTKYSQKWHIHCSVVDTFIWTYSLDTNHVRLLYMASTTMVLCTWY